MLGHDDQGAGTPAIVFVHGLACAREDWKAQLEALSPAHRCVSVDLPGHGATPAGGPLAIGPFGEALAATVAELGALPAVLVGHSMGCRVVLEAARRLDAQVRGVALVDGSLRGAGDPQAARAATLAAIESRGFERYLRELFEAMFTDASDPALREHVVRRALRLDARAGAALIADLAAFDAGHMDAALAAIRAPVLVIQSTGVDARGRRVPLERGQSTPFVDAVRARLPAARVEVIPGIGHFTMHEAPQQVSELIAQLAAGPGG